MTTNLDSFQGAIRLDNASNKCTRAGVERTGKNDQKLEKITDKQRNITPMRKSYWPILESEDKAVLKVLSI